MESLWHSGAPFEREQRGILFLASIIHFLCANTIFSFDHRARFSMWVQLLVCDEQYLSTYATYVS